MRERTKIVGKREARQWTRCVENMGVCRRSVGSGMSERECFFIVGQRDKIGKIKNDFKGKGARWEPRISEERGRSALITDGGQNGLDCTRSLGKGDKRTPQGQGRTGGGGTGGDFYG